MVDPEVKVVAIPNPFGLTGATLAKDLTYRDPSEGSLSSKLNKTLGIDKIIYREDRIAKSVDDPKAFIKARAEALALIMNSAPTKYKGFFDDLASNKSMPESRRHEIAEKMTENWAESAKVLVNEQYPVVVIEEQARRIKKAHQDSMF